MACPEQPGPGSSVAKRAPHPIVDLFAGTFGSMVGMIVGSPFDVVKVRIQTATSSLKASILRDTIAETWKKEGIFGFYKGLLPPLLTEAILNPIWFGTYATVAHYIQPDKHTPLTPSEAFSSGLVAGVMGSFATAPCDLVKVRLQIDREVDRKTRQRPWPLVKDIMNKEGLLGFYRRGFWVSMVSIY